MIRVPVNQQYSSYVWVIDEEGNPKTGIAANLSVAVMDESDGLFSNPVPTEVDSVNAPGLYKASFTPDAIGFWKVFWDCTATDADISGGEVILVCDDCVEETNSFNYPAADATEKDITELFATTWSAYYTRRRTHKGTYIDMSAVAGDVSAPGVTIRRYVKVDGSNWQRIDQTIINNAALVADPCVRIQEETLKREYKITMQLSVGLNAQQVVPYHYITEFEDLCT